MSQALCPAPELGHEHNRQPTVQGASKIKHQEAHTALAAGTGSVAKAQARARLPGFAPYWQMTLDTIT